MAMELKAETNREHNVANCLVFLAEQPSPTERWEREEFPE
jgi:hypothetical protein